MANGNKNNSKEDEGQAIRIACPPSGATASARLLRPGRVRIATAALVGCGIVSPATAQEGPQALDPITVIGARGVDVPLSNVAGSVTIVEGEEIRRELPTAPRIEDILRRQVPGFNPTNNGVRQIRGRTAQVFVNGVPVNEQLRASSGSDVDLLLPDQLGGIEVGRGANSAYGFGSPGGIVALSTPRARSEELTLTTRARGSVNPHHPDGSYQATLYQSAAKIIDRLDFHIGGAVAYDGSEHDPDGNLADAFNGPGVGVNPREAIAALDGNIGYDFREFGSLRLTGTFNYVDVQKGYDINEPGVFREEFAEVERVPAGDDSFRRAHTLNLAYENPDVLGSAVKLEAFTSETYTEVYRLDGEDVLRDEQTNEYLGFRSRVTTPLDLVYDGLRLTYGADVIRNRYHRPVFFDDTDERQSFISPDTTLDSYAGYAQAELPLGDFLLSGGLRHEIYEGEVDPARGVGGIDGGSIDGFDLTLFNVGLVYFLTDQVELYGTFSQGAEITQLGRAARAATRADQIDPEPAKSNQYEIGARSEWDDLSFGVAGFYTTSNKLSSLQINPDDPDGPLIPLREPRDIWGLEGSLDWRIGERWGVGGVVTWQDGNRETEDGKVEPIGSRDIPPILVAAYLDYAPFGWWRNRLQLDYRGERDPFGDPREFNEGQVDRELLVNVAAEFDVGPGVLELGVRNLFNNEYVSIANSANASDFSWIPEEGTRVSIGYSLTW